MIYQKTTQLLNALQTLRRCSRCTTAAWCGLWTTWRRQISSTWTGTATPCGRESSAHCGLHWYCMVLLLQDDICMRTHVSEGTLC